MPDQFYPLTAAQVQRQLDSMFRDLNTLEDPDAPEDSRAYAELDYKIRMQVVKDLTTQTETQIESEFVQRYTEQIRKQADNDSVKQARERLDKAIGRTPYTPKGAKPV